jgi:hypothetical protein
MKRIAVVAAASVAMALAGCGATPAPVVPDAWALAHKLPGCSATVEPRSQLARLAREVLACQAGQFAGVEIATFRTAKTARAWYATNTELARITEGAGAARKGEPLGVVGNGWATVLSVAATANGGTAQAETIQHYLGGRVLH